MRTILLSFFVFAMFSFFSSAAPLDQTIDGFPNIMGLDVSKQDKKPLSKKMKPPNKLPGPKILPEPKSFGLFSQIATSMIPKINAFKQDDQPRKKHVFEMHFAPLHGESKKTPYSLQENASKDAEATHLLTENQNHMTLRKLEKTSATLPVNLH